MFDLSSAQFDGAMTPEEYAQAKADFQAFKSRIEFLHSLNEEDVKGIFKVSDADKTLIREGWGEYENASKLLPHTKEDSDEVEKLMTLNDQLGVLEAQLLEAYDQVRRNRMLVNAKAYRKISVLRDNLAAQVKDHKKEAVPILARMKEFFKKRSDAIKAAAKAKKEADRLKAEAANLAAAEAAK